MTDDATSPRTDLAEDALAAAYAARREQVHVLARAIHEVFEDGSVTSMFDGAA